MLENVLIGLLLLGALGFLGHRVYRQLRAKACEEGNCGCKKGNVPRHLRK